MSNELNQRNKEIVWDYWQKLNHVGVDNVPAAVRAAVHADVDWNGSAPIDQLLGVENLISGFWLPLLHSFPDIKIRPYVFMGGIESGVSEWGGEAGTEWVSACGYLTGTFANDWLGIPATGIKTNIWFGQFYRMHEGKIAESYVQYDVLAVMRQAGYQVLPPSPGFDGGKIPGPVTKDGILHTEQDPLESRKTMQMVEAMGKGLMRYDRSRDGDDMSRMEQDKYWSLDMKWYGPSGIGGCFTLEEFEDFHQRNWLHGFGDRQLEVERGGVGVGFFSEGMYACGGIWDMAFSYNHGDYANIPATGKLITLRDFDWYRREGDYLIENWVPIDIIDLCRQLDVDLMERLRLQIELRKQSPAAYW